MLSLRHTLTCRCPCCILINKKVSILGVRINFTQIDRPVMTVHVSPRNIAYQDDMEVQNALIDLVLDYHLENELKVGECTFRSSDEQEHFITRRKRNDYTICFHTLPSKVEPALVGSEVLSEAGALSPK